MSADIFPGSAPGAGIKSVEQWVQRTVRWLKEKAKDAGCTGSVVGLSGGVDSAVAAALCYRAFDDASLAVMLPCDSAGEDLQYARMVAEAVGMPTASIDLEAAYHALGEVLFCSEGPQRLARANVKPRLRMTALYYLAQSRGGLVVGTDNWAELYLGYFTKFGDGGCDILPLARLTKGQVRQVARHLGVPSAVVHREPTAGLWPGQTDEGELGFSYDEVDDYLLGREVNRQAASKIERLHEASEHKRSMPPVPPFGLSQKAAGGDGG